MGTDPSAALPNKWPGPNIIAAIPIDSQLIEARVLAIVGKRRLLQILETRIDKAWNRVVTVIVGQAMNSVINEGHKVLKLPQTSPNTYG